MADKIIKNFLVTGTPRSCTTWFCKTLNAHNGIWVPEFTNYEPFNPHGIPKTTNKLPSTFHIFFLSKRNIEKS